MPIINYAKSTSIVFIFLRWSPHFASFYTSQFLPNTTSYTSFFPILHLLPVDTGSDSRLEDIVRNYEENILSNTNNTSFNDDVSSIQSIDVYLFLLCLKLIFILNELESVEYLRQMNSSFSLSSITLDGNRQRLFDYLLIGKQCNSTWTIFERIDLTNASLERMDVSLNLCTLITYPTLDVTTSDNSGQLI